MSVSVEPFGKDLDYDVGKVCIDIGGLDNGSITARPLRRRVLITIAGD